MRRTANRLIVVIFGAFIAVFVVPEWPVIPVFGATPADWNPGSFWSEPWGKSGVHKGIDIFAPKGTAIVAPTYGLVVFRGSIPLGGKVIAILGPKLRLHYFAHLESISVSPGFPVRTGSVIGQVGDSGNARGKPPHLHYAVVSLIPYPWRVDISSQGWKKMFFMDPDAWLRAT